MLSAFLILLITLVIICYYWCQQTFTYWKRKGIPYVKPLPLLGNTKDALLLKRNFGLILSDIYNDPKWAQSPVVGIYVFHQPGLVIRDLDLIKSILIKDFQYFGNHFANSNDSLGVTNLFFARGPLWKEVRHKISPVFASGKVKHIYNLMLKVGEELERQIWKRGNRYVLDVKDISKSFTIEMIATIAFGINTNSLTDPNCDFRKQCDTIFFFNLRRWCDFLVMFFLPSACKIFNARIFPKECSKFLRSTIGYILKERENSGLKRNDLIDILVSLKQEAAQDTSGKHFASHHDNLVAQAAGILLAGFQTSSSAMNFTLYHLAKHPDVQSRLRAEIIEALKESEDGKLTYDQVQNLIYLDMVISEILRLYPFLPFLDRQFTQPSNEMTPYSLQPHHDYVFSNGIPVFIPIYALQRDPKYWKDPNSFDPERFSPENKSSINPMLYQPFGTGPRKCIGERIGLLQTKVGIIYILKDHVLSLCEKTPAEMEFDPKALILQSGDIPLEITRITT